MLINIKKNEENSKSAAKKAIKIAGAGLGDLIWRVYQGDFDEDSDINRELLKYKGTEYFIIGGSIGTNGYSKAILPLIAEKQILDLSKEHNKNKPNARPDGIPQILSHDFNSSNAGALGAFNAFTETAKNSIRQQAKSIYEDNKIPVVLLIDVGGTKINMIPAYLDRDGQPNYQIVQSHSFPTCKNSSPSEFYRQLAWNIKLILDYYQTGIFKMVKQTAIGQPGRFDEEKGIIKDGAKDLGTAENLFLGCNPSALCESALRDLGCDMDVYVCNDGIAQFNGLLTGIKINNVDLWKKLCGKGPAKIMYLGLGTGLGSGFGEIYCDGSYKTYSFREAYKIRSKWETVDYSFVKDTDKELLGQFRLPCHDYQYGDLLSGKFFQRFMHFIDYVSVDGKLCFIPFTGMTCVPDDFRSTLLGGINNSSSPLNAKIINEILAKEIISSKAELIVDCNEQKIRENLNRILKTYSKEIGKTLVKEIGASAYSEVVARVVAANKNGNVVHFAGIGKSHSIGDNLSLKFRNLGICSNCLQLTGANAENLTAVREGDLVFMISNSGKAWELLDLIPYIQKKGCYTVAITGEADSPLARNCDSVITSKVKDVTNDIVRLPEAPTATTSAALAVGTAIGIVAAHYFDYGKDQFYLDHPNLVYDDNIKYEGMTADTSFDTDVKINDIFETLSDAINELNNTQIDIQITRLLKKILVSHYNERTVFITGSGSSLHAAEKIAATMTSIGIDAEAVNPAQLPHGDFAHIKPRDLLIIISFSGETSNLKYVYELARDKQVESVLITGNENSYLAKVHGGNYVIVGKNADDGKLISIPNQKILPSFLNLVVGDAVAVLLAWLIKTTHRQFAELGHRGGAVERDNSNYGKYLSDKNNLTMFYINSNETVKEHFCSILEKHKKTVNPCFEGNKNDALIETIGQEIESYIDRTKDPGQEVLIFGMGPMGIGYIGRIMSELNKELIYVEKDAGKRSRNFVAESVKNTEVEAKDVLSPYETEKIAVYALRIDIIFIAVGKDNIKDLIDAVSFIVLRRYAYNIQASVNFVFDENFQVYDNTLELLRYEIYKKLEDPNIKNYFNEYVGLVPAVNEAIVPEIKEGKVKVEPCIAPLYIDRSKWKKQKHEHFPEFNGSIQFADNFTAMHMRKLWMHNMAHAMTAFLGGVCGYKTICDAIADTNIEIIVKRAMASVGSVLYRRWDYSNAEHPDIDSYISWCVEKYKNNFLEDTVERVAKDPERKLRENDRLIGPLNYVYKYSGTVCEDILLGIAAAMKTSGGNYEEIKNTVLSGMQIGANGYDELAKAEKKLKKMIDSSKQRRARS